jgi:hypothetical protein
LDLAMSNAARPFGNTITLLRLPGTWPEMIYWGVAAAMTVGFIVTAVLMALDTRTINGYDSVWLKPFKFEISLAIHAASLALVIRCLSPSFRQGNGMLIVAMAFLAACTVEMGWIILQAARAQQSHFNLTTPFNSFMFSVMAFMAVIIVSAAGAIGLAVLADGQVLASPPLKAAIIVGLVGGTVLTLITAFTIGGRLSPYVGGVPAPEARMMLTGWSRMAGDLRVSHFLATHMIQALPLFAVAIERFAPGRVALVLVLAFAAGWTALTWLEFRGALKGEPSFFAQSLR